MIDHNFYIDFPLSDNNEISFECDVNSQMYKQLFGVDYGNNRDLTAFSIILKKPYKVQIRRNKKKRINKKWGKLYGYKTMFKKVIVTDAKIDNILDDNIEFSGKTVYVI